MACKHDSSALYDSCNPFQGSTVFDNAAGDKAVVLTVCGLPDGVSIPVMVYAGPMSQGCVCPLSVSGVPVELTAANNQQIITVPGYYELDTSAVPADADPCVKVFVTEVDADLGECMCGGGAGSNLNVTVELPDPTEPTPPDPCVREPVTAKVEGPGTFTLADLGLPAGSNLIALNVMHVAGAPTLAGVYGTPVPLTDGEVRGWDCVPHPSGDTFCTIADFTIELADGDCVELAGTATAT